MIHLLKEGGRAANCFCPMVPLPAMASKQRIRQKLLEDCNLHTPSCACPTPCFSPMPRGGWVATNLLFFTKGEPTQNTWLLRTQIAGRLQGLLENQPIQLSEFDSLKAWWANREVNEQAWQCGLQHNIKANGYNLDIKNPHLRRGEKAAK